MKTCTRCNKTKELSEFYKDKSRKDGLTHRCRECKREDNRAYRQANHDREAERSREWRLRNSERRRDYNRERRLRNSEYNRERYRENPEKYLEYNREWRQNNPEKKKSYDHARRARMVGLYGEAPDHRRITEQMELLANDPCMWCGTTEAEEYEWDHLVPLAKGGPHIWWNICRSCKPCNRSKHDKIPPLVGLYDWKS